MVYECLAKKEREWLYGRGDIYPKTWMVYRTSINISRERKSSN